MEIGAMLWQQKHFKTENDFQDTHFSDRTSEEAEP